MIKYIIGLIIFCFFVGGLILVSLTKENTKKDPPVQSATVQVSYPKYGAINNELKVYGTVSYDPQFVDAITLQNDVVVRKIFVTIGQEITQGEALISIKPTLNMQLNVINATNDLNYAKQQLNRVIKLQDQFMATSAEVQTAKLNLAKAQAAWDTIQFKQGGKEQVIAAKTSGIITALNAAPGQILTQGTIIITIADKNKFLIRFGIEPDKVAHLKVGQKVTITYLDNTNNIISAIKTITGQLDPQSGLVDVIVPMQIDDTNQILLGILVKGIITVAIESNHLLIPRTAVLFDHGEPYIFVSQKGIAKKVMITIGIDNGKEIEVKSGLSKSDLIVVQGNYELEDGMKLNIKGIL